MKKKISRSLYMYEDLKGQIKGRIEKHNMHSVYYLVDSM